MSAHCGQLRWNEVIVLASQLVRDGWMSSVRHSDPIAIDELNQFFNRVAVLEIVGHVLRPGAAKLTVLYLIFSASRDALTASA
jgi:hypothetical protein